MVRNTNIQVNVDVSRAVNPIMKLNTEMKKVGMSAQTSASQVSTAMQQAGAATQRAGDTAAASAIKFQTMGQGMLNLSTAAVQTFTSISNLDRAYNRAAMAAIGLQRATDLLNRKQFKLNEEIHRNGEGTSKAILLTNELATARADLAVKTDKLKIETAAVLDVQLLFAANIVNVGVSSMMIMGVMLSANTKKLIFQKIALVAHTVALKLNSVATWSNVLGKKAALISVTGLTIGLGGATAATGIMTIATKALTIALGPVGLIIIGISAAMLAYDTNFKGFKDTVNGFLGIQEEVNIVVDAGTEIMNLQVDAINATDSALQKLPSSYQAALRELKIYQDEIRGFNREILIPVMGALPIRLKNDRVTDPQTGGIGLPSNIPKFLYGALAIRGIGVKNTAIENASESKIQKANVIVTNILKMTDEELERFEFLTLFATPEGATRAMNAVKLNKIIKDIVTRPSGFFAPFDIAEENRFSPVFGGSFLLNQEDTDFDFWYRRVKAGLITGLSGEERRLFRDYDQKVTRRGTGKQSIGKSQALSDLGNREFIKQAMGIDIGAAAATMSRDDAIRIAILEKQLGAAGAGLNLASALGVSIRNNRILSALLNAGGDIFNSKGFRNMRNLIGSGLVSATAAFQVSNIATPQFILSRNTASDAFANKGGGAILSVAFGLFTGATGGALSRGAANYLKGKNIFSQFTIARNAAKALGGDEEAFLQLQLLREQFSGTTDIKGAMKALSRSNIIAQELAERNTTRLSSLGLDIDIGHFITWMESRFSHGSGNRKYYTRQRRRRWIKGDPRSITIQLLDDIGASAGISIPSEDKLMSITQSFNLNGMFTNFNNLAITNDAMAGLNITEQSVFNIRFNYTRGDRELQNRLRFVELLEASSSGVSAI